MSAFLSFIAFILVCHAGFSAHQYISISSETSAAIPFDVFVEVLVGFVFLLIGQTIAKSSELKSIDEENDSVLRTLSSLDVPEYHHFNHRGKITTEIKRCMSGGESKKRK